MSHPRATDPDNLAVLHLLRLVARDGADGRPARVDLTVIFVDSGGFFALLVEEDEFHARAVEILRKARSQRRLLLTTNAVVFETHALLIARVRNGLEVGLRFLDAVARGSAASNGSRRQMLPLFEATLLAFLVLVTVGAGWLARVYPKLVNVPRRDYWFAPERRQESARRLLRHMLWLAALLVLFITTTNQLVFSANLRADGPRLSTTEPLVVMGSIIGR